MLLEEVLHVDTSDKYPIGGVGFRLGQRLISVSLGSAGGTEPLGT